MQTKPDPIPPTESRVVRVRLLTAINRPRGGMGRDEAGAEIDMEPEAYEHHVARGNVCEVGEYHARAAAEREGAALIAKAKADAEALVAAARSAAAARLKLAASKGARS